MLFTCYSELRISGYWPNLCPCPPSKNGNSLPRRSGSQGNAAGRTLYKTFGRNMCKTMHLESTP